MHDPALQHQILEWIRNLGNLGVFLGMFLESSIFPIPSEVIIIGAGALGIPLKAITVYGSLGATLGAMVGYCLGRYCAQPVLCKYGKFICIKPHHIQKAEDFAKKHGAWGVLLGRIFPIIPFKVFSIASGITRIPFVPFVTFTLIGVIPRIILLSIFGEALVRYTTPALIVLAVCILVFIVYKFAVRKTTVR